MTPSEEKKLAKAERDRFLFIIATLFRTGTMMRDIGGCSAEDSFQAAESQLAEAEKRGIDFRNAG